MYEVWDKRVVQRIQKLLCFWWNGDTSAISSDDDETKVKEYNVELNKINPLSSYNNRFKIKNVLQEVVARTTVEWQHEYFKLKK